MAGVFALVAALLAFAVPMALPLLAQRWRSLGVLLLAGLAFFAWLNADITAHDGGGAIGAFLGGLMLVGFAGGVLARFVMLLGRPRPAPDAAADRPDPPSASE